MKIVPSKGYRLLAVDPGTFESAYAYSLEPGSYVSEKLSNEDLLCLLRSWGERGIFTHLVIEMVASYGKVAGKSLFQTCVWIGRIVEAAGIPVKYVYRKEVVTSLTGLSKGSDSGVRAAIMDLFGRERSKVIGTKKQPGPLLGFKDDMWAALAVWLHANTTVESDPTWLADNPFWSRETKT